LAEEKAKSEELSFIRKFNNEELLRLEAEEHKLTLENKALEKVYIILYLEYQ